MFVGYFRQFTDPSSFCSRTPTYYPSRSLRTCLLVLSSYNEVLLIQRPLRKRHSIILTWLPYDRQSTLGPSVGGHTRLQLFVSKRDFEVRFVGPSPRRSPSRVFFRHMKRTKILFGTVIRKLKYTLRLTVEFCIFSVYTNSLTYVVSRVQTYLVSENPRPSRNPQTLHQLVYRYIQKETLNSDDHVN